METAASRDDGYFSMIRGVCWHRGDRRMYVNVKLFYLGTTDPKWESEKDLVAFDLCCAILDFYFWHMMGWDLECVEPDRVMPGMMGDRPQMSGDIGYELYTVKS